MFFKMKETRPDPHYPQLRPFLPGRIYAAHESVGNRFTAEGAAEASTAADYKLQEAFDALLDAEEVLKILRQHGLHRAADLQLQLITRLKIVTCRPGASK